MKKLNILLLCNLPTKDANALTVIHHILAFKNFSRHNIFLLSNTGALPSRLELDRFDVLVIHYSIWITLENFISKSALERIRQFAGLKIQFSQDEYRTVNAIVSAMRHIGIDVLFTCVPTAEIDKVYPNESLPNVCKVNNLTGFVPDELLGLQVLPIAARPLDVSYRTRKCPYWLGKLGTEKWRIVPQFLSAAEHYNLKTDLSYNEEDRLYGKQWIKLLSSSKCVLGVESGASVFDFTGQIQKDVEKYMADHPSAEFEEVREKFFPEEEGKITLNQISPRCFEAAALRTAMILFEGEYSGILKPWRHYIPLKKDFSNIEEVVAMIKNSELLQTIADCAYKEIALNPLYSYEYFIAQFDAIVEQEYVARKKQFTLEPYTRAGYLVALAQSPAYLIHRLILMLLQRCFLGTRIRKVLHTIWYKIPLERREKIRPLLKLIGR